VTSTPDLRIADSVLDPSAKGRVVRQRARGTDRPLYHVRLFLAGRDLPYVRAVTYRLHPTFPNPVRRVERTAANQACELEIWTWGIFDITAEVEDKQGRTYTLTHTLTYGEELERGIDTLLNE